MSTPACIYQTDFSFPNQTGVYKGKVRDVYFFQDKMAMVVSDRVSAFDHIMPKPIPYKGAILNSIAQFNLEASSDIVPNWLEATPDPNVSYGKRCDPIPIEMVIRGYLVGHAHREYALGKRTLCGEKMPEGMVENQAFPKPIITPATKAEEGHDMDISKKEILEQGIVNPEIYEKLEKYTHELFQRGTELAAKRGLILVDTKYEFGIYNGQVYLIDEVHTPDSSRYFYADGYEEKLSKGEKQKQLSKEFLREWLMDHNFQGLEGQTIPEITPESQMLISERYQELYRVLMGKPFQIPKNDDPQKRIVENLLDFLSRVKK